VQPAFGTHLGAGAVEKGRFAFASLHGVMVTLPFKYAAHAVEVANACGVNAAPSQHENSPFPFAGQALSCSVRKLIMMLHMFEDLYVLDRWEVTFSCFGASDELVVVSKDTKGAICHPLFDDYGVAFVDSHDGVIQAVLDAVASSPSSDRRWVVASFDLRVSVVRASGPNAQDVHIYRSHGPFTNDALHHSVFVQMLAAVATHMDQGGDPAQIPAVAQAACDDPGGACRSPLIPGDVSKIGKKQYSQRSPPPEGFTFTQFIAYGHVLKQLVAQALRVQESFKPHNHSPPSMSHHQARTAVRSVMRVVRDMDKNKVVFSEDLELSVTIGGPAFNGRHFIKGSRFILRLLDEVQRIRDRRLVQLVAVIPSHVWKGVATSLADILLGTSHPPSFIRASADRMNENCLHAFALFLDTVGYSTFNYGTWRKLSFPLILLSGEHYGELRFLAQPPSSKASFEAFLGRSLTSLYPASVPYSTLQPFTPKINK